jgi:hypothetical protein
MNGTGERRLLYADALRATREMLLFGNCNEISNLAQLHKGSVRE